MTDSTKRLTRRAAIHNGSLVLAATAIAPQFLAPASLWADEADVAVRAGLVTDLHYADKPAGGTRHYRETLDKLETAAEKFGSSKLNFIVELGDLVDAADSVSTELGYLKTINTQFSAIHKDRHYVLGNHCVDTLTKEEFLGQVEQPRSYYSFDRSGVHFIVLDACFTSGGKPYGRKNSKWDDANLPPAELEWLEADLQSTDNPVVVFAHQRLDVSSAHGVKNNAAVRKILEANGQVLAVFQGHSHQNDVKQIGGIHYCTLVAMVEGSGADNNAFSVLEISKNHDLRVVGFLKQNDHQWKTQQAG